MENERLDGLASKYGDDIVGTTRFLTSEQACHCLFDTCVHVHMATLQTGAGEAGEGAAGEAGEGAAEEKAGN